MTSRRRPRTGAAWLVAPLAAGSLALGTDWALQHDPVPTASVAARAAPTVTSPLQRKAQLAARRLQQSQTGLVRLETAVRQRSAQLSRLEADARAIRDARGTGRAVPRPGGGAAAAPAPAAPLPAPVSVPAPPVNTTTGAS